MTEVLRILFSGNLMHIAGAVPSSIELTMRSMVRSVFERKALTLGIMMAGCSMAGMALISVSARLPAAIAFPINSSATIITASLVSVIRFGEKNHSNGFSCWPERLCVRYWSINNLKMQKRRMT